MAGLGRRTHYRKHLTDKVLHDFPIPSSNECIAKVVATRGGNQFDVLLAATDPSSSSAVAAAEDRIPQLAILPTKFRKLVWVKRNDFVIVQTGGDEDGDDDQEPEEDAAPDSAEKDSKVEKGNKNDTGGIRFIINHILYKEQVKHLRSKGLWPIDDDEFADDAMDPRESGGINGAAAATKVADDGIVYDNDYSDDENADADLFVNTNRVAALTLQDSSSSSDESDEDD